MSQLTLHFGGASGSRKEPQKPRPSPRPQAKQQPLALVVSEELPETLAPAAMPQSGVPTIKGKERIERVLRGLIGPKVMVHLTENRSTMISARRQKGVLYVRIHAIFQHAPEYILEAVVGFLGLRKATQKESWLIDQWIETHRHLIKKPQDERIRILPRGEVHDLQEIYDEVNEKYFKNTIGAQITWSIAARGQKRASIRMGSYSHDQKLIRIHPALDQSFVPQYFVAFVVFHEMLHQAHGSIERKDGSRWAHTPAFKRDEKLFEQYNQAKAWEFKNLRKLLRF